MIQKIEGNFCLTITLLHLHKLSLLFIYQFTSKNIPAGKINKSDRWHAVNEFYVPL